MCIFDISYLLYFLRTAEFRKLPLKQKKKLFYCKRFFARNRDQAPNGLQIFQYFLNMPTELGILHLFYIVYQTRNAYHL
jgi:hypothetical protein